MSRRDSADLISLAQRRAAVLRQQVWPALTTPVTALVSATSSGSSPPLTQPVPQKQARDSGTTSAASTAPGSAAFAGSVVTQDALIVLLRHVHQTWTMAVLSLRTITARLSLPRFQARRRVLQRQAMRLLEDAAGLVNRVDDVIQRQASHLRRSAAHVALSIWQQMDLLQLLAAGTAAMILARRALRRICAVFRDPDSQRILLSQTAGLISLISGLVMAAMQTQLALLSQALGTLHHSAASLIQRCSPWIWTGVMAVTDTVGDGVESALSDRPELLRLAMRIATLARATSLSISGRARAVASSPLQHAPALAWALASRSVSSLPHIQRSQQAFRRVWYDHLSPL